MNKFCRFQYNYLLFGLSQAPQSSQGVIDHVFRGILIRFVTVFLDDITVSLATFEERMAHFIEGLTNKESGLSVNTIKLIPFAQCHKFIGHIITP